MPQAVSDGIVADIGYQILPVDGQTLGEEEAMISSMPLRAVVLIGYL